jgi:anti-sigma28 factor (negative regulator of flagellin synthesis)
MTNMKLTNTSIETLAPSGAGASSAINKAGKDSRAAAASAANSDSVKLSSASQLLNLAKASAPDRSAKLASIAALVRTGQYSTDTTSVSHAVVEGHIQ